jgi:hypothetical protein
MEAKSQSPAKTPMIKTQAPKNHQSPMHVARMDWRLVLLWNLVIGIWIFSSITSQPSTLN